VHFCLWKLDGGAVHGTVTTVTGERLTRSELGWLLAQEARGAAHALRAEVKEMRASLRPPPPPPGPGITAKGALPPQSALPNIPGSGAGPRIRFSHDGADEPEERISSLPGERHLNALDEAINLLATLQQPSQPKVKRRGRIDLAALLYDLAPNCNLAIEPGAGTEVIGDEHELRRMFHLLLNQSTGGSGDDSTLHTIELRRQDQWIHIRVELGPDTAATSDVERRWLSRMAVKHGGRLELHGRKQIVVLPAESSNQEEVEQLKRELQQAQLLGEAYAKELATALSQDSSIAEPGRLSLDDALALGAAEARADNPYVAMRSLAAALLPLLQRVARGEKPEGADTWVSHLQALTRAPASAGQTRAGQHASVRLRDVVRSALLHVGANAQRRAIVVHETYSGDPTVVSSAQTLTTLVELLLSQAIDATPAGAMVNVRVAVDNTIEVEDSGPAVPSHMAAGLLAGAVDPASVGRPGNIGLVIAAALATDLGVTLSLHSDKEHTFARLALK
jgi:two-component system, OmpR family, sensor kinase